MKKLPWYYPGLLVIAAAIILSLPYMLSDRLDSETLIGSESTLNAKIVKDLSESNADPGYNPYHHLLAFISGLGGVVFASKAVPFSLGIVAVILSYAIIRRYSKDDMQTAIIIIMLILSPLYIYSFTVSNPWSLFVVMLLLSFYLFEAGGFFRYLSYAVIICLSFFGIIESGVAMLFIAILTYRSSKDRIELILLFFFTLLISLFLYISASFNYQRLNLLRYIEESLTIFGGFRSFGVFFLLLAVYGIIVSWKKQYANFPYVVSVLLLFLMSIFFCSRLKVMLNLVLSVLAGIGLYSLIRMRWSLAIVKRLTIFTLLLGLLFSALSTVSGLSEFAPDEEMKVALKTLDAIEENATVLSHYRYGHWLEYYAGQEPYTTENSYNSFSEHEKWNQSLMIFSSDSLSYIEQMLANNSIEYVLLTEEMKPILLDEKLDPSFQFIIQNSNSFYLVRKRADVQLWKFLPENRIR